MTIRRLPPEVADAIAAGEVVERPASVVKELVENALDAGARGITVDVRGGGRNLLRVADDGSGIPADELELAFTRHATSKLTGLRDLEAVGSLGFRGEALASIAAVAHVECQSSGGRIRLRAGAVVDRGGASVLTGTVVEVRDLFANTPARLKFLKREATEVAAIVRMVGGYAIGYPDVRFRLTVDGRLSLQTAGTGAVADAVGAVLGRSTSEELLPVSGGGVTGVVSQPRMSRGNRDAILVYVNRRPVSSRALVFALEDCYRGSLERGRHPVAAIDVAVPLEAVDVNVHPTKREVRFKDEGSVFAAVQRAVRAALTGAEAYRLPIVASVAAPGSGVRLPREVVHKPPPPLVDVARPPADVLRPLGQVAGGYLVAEGDEGLLLVDQHAAHERILYNRFLARLVSGETLSQPLLIPAAVELDRSQMAAAADLRGALEAFGFSWEEFGPTTVKLLAGPAETPASRIASALEEILTELSSRGLDERVHAIASSLACHSAVRFGDSLDQLEQRRLLTELSATENAATCPHGRPTQLVVEWQQLKRHFRRNY